MRRTAQTHSAEVLVCTLAVDTSTSLGFGLAERLNGIDVVAVGQRLKSAGDSVEVVRVVSVVLETRQCTLVGRIIGLYHGFLLLWSVDV